MAIKINNGISSKKTSTSSITGVITKEAADGTVTLGNGTRDHSKIYNKDLPDQHPIEAITGLADALKQIGVTEKNLEAATKELAKHLPTDTAPAKVEVKNGVLVLTLINGDVIRYAGSSSIGEVKSVNNVKPDAKGNITLTAETIDPILLSSALFQDVKSDIAEVAADVNTLDTKVTNVENTVKTFDNRIKTVETKEKALETKVNTFDTRIKTVETKETALETTVNTFDSRITAVESKEKALETKVNTIETKEKALETKVGTVETKETALETRVTDVETTVKTVVNKEKALETKVSTIEAAEKSLDSKVNIIDASVNALTEKETALETKVTAVETKEKALETSINTTNAKVNTLETKTNILETQINTISGDLSTVKGKVDALPSATELQAELDAKQDKISATNPISIDSVSGLQSELDKIPENYLANAEKSADGKKLTITKSDGSIVEFQGGSEAVIYTEGTGIDISNEHVISVDQTELDAGITTTKIAAGGIAKGTDLTGKSINEVLEMLLAPYIAPVAGTLTLTAAAGTVEIGSSKVLSKFKCTYTANDGSIVKAALYDGSTLLAESTGDSYTSGAEISLSESKTYTSAKTLTCKLTTEKGAVLEKTGSYAFATYLYTGSAATTEVPTTGLTKQTNYSTTNGCNVTFGTGHYVFFYTDTAKTTIQQYAAGSWNNMETTDCGKVTITLANGTTKEYFAYRTDKLGNGATWQLKIV